MLVLELLFSGNFVWLFSWSYFIKIGYQNKHVWNYFVKFKLLQMKMQHCVEILEILKSCFHEKFCQWKWISRYSCFAHCWNFVKSTTLLKSWFHEKIFKWYKIRSSAALILSLHLTKKWLVKTILQIGFCHNSWLIFFSVSTSFSIHNWWWVENTNMLWILRSTFLLPWTCIWISSTCSSTFWASLATQEIKAFSPKFSFVPAVPEMLNKSSTNQNIYLVKTKKQNSTMCQ